MENKNLTAVEWLIEKLMKGELMNSPEELIIQAKQMEKEQIMKAFLEGKVNHSKDWAEQYYNDTYATP